MSEPISRQRLTEIRDIGNQLRDPTPEAAERIRVELLAEVDRLATALAEAREREASRRTASEKTARELGATQFDRDRLAARVADAEAKLKAALGTLTTATARVAELEAEREQIIGGLPYAHGQAVKLRRELDIEHRYSRGLRDTLRRIGQLNPITHDAAMAIIRDGIPAANALALEHQRLNDTTQPAAAPDHADGSEQ